MLLVSLCFIELIVIIKNKRVLIDRTIFARGLLRDQKLACSYLRFKQKNKRVSDYFTQNNYKKIGFFGYSEFGRIVLNDLIEDRVNIVFGLDEAYGEYGLDMDIYHPDCSLPDADVILLITENIRVRNMINKKREYTFITLEQIIKEISK